MASDPRDAEIRRLERDIKWAREELARRDEQHKSLEASLHAERSWRRTFQRLMKAASLGDTLSGWSEYDD